jgi:hypothetical protein
MEIEAALSELQSLLYGWNYAVFLHRYRLPFISSAAAQDYVVQALPNSKLGGIQPISRQELLDEVEQSLRYAGDAGSGPKPAAVNSSKFEQLLISVLSYLEQATSGAIEILCFWLKSGHPDYPVFWDFAFVIIGAQGVEVFIGSSSD